MTPRKKKPSVKPYTAAPPAKAVLETRVFKSGNSYAVRLPKPLYSGGEGSVYMRKLDNGRLLIVPKRKTRWPTGFFESFGNIPSDFEAPSRPAPRTGDDARDATLFRDDE